jgi:hypothetical protein
VPPARHTAVYADHFDLGPEIRLRPIRDRSNALLREADAEREWATDPANPRITVRRARRVDPLVALGRAGTLEGKHIDAIEKLRQQLEFGALRLTIPSLLRAGRANDGSEAAALRRVGHHTCAREAITAMGRPNGEAVIWVVLGGTLAGLARHARMSWRTVRARLVDGADELARHYGL